MEIVPPIKMMTSGQGKKSKIGADSKVANVEKGRAIGLDCPSVFSNSGAPVQLTCLPM